MNIIRFLLPTALASLAAACFSSSAPSGETSTPTTNDAGVRATDASDGTAFALGENVVEMNGCTACHGVDLSGNLKQSSGVYSANITPDMDTGIGSWTLTNLTNALRLGTDDQGEMLCSAMPLFPNLSDGDIANMYAYLRGIPAVSKAQTDTDCEGNPTTGDDDGGGSDASSTDAGTPVLDSGGGADSAADAANDSGVDASDPCPHKVCVQGASLAPSCGACAAAVCTHDPACCNTAWGATCVADVAQYCTTKCN